jgi:uncharacterized protein (TIGR02996 family)
MTSEEDFLRKLDENPDDWQTMLVLADWLQDRDDPSHEGWRAIVRLGLRPWWFSWSMCWGFWSEENQGRKKDIGEKKHFFPHDWFLLVEKNRIIGVHTDTIEFEVHTPSGRDVKSHVGDIYKALAVAFAKLPEARRDELLGGVLT